VSLLLLVHLSESLQTKINTGGEKGKSKMFGRMIHRRPVLRVVRALTRTECRTGGRGETRMRGVSQLSLECQAGSGGLPKKKRFTSTEELKGKKKQRGEGQEAILDAV